MAEYRDGYKVDPSTGLTEPEMRAGLTRADVESASAADDQTTAPRTEPMAAAEVQTAEAAQPTSAGETPTDEQPSDDAVIYAKGVNGQITIDGHWLTIERKGWGRVGHSKGDRRIPLASITAVQVRPAGSFANGFIRFSVPGSPELRGGLNNAGKDENAVIFTKKHSDDFEKVRLAVEDYIVAQRSGPAPAAQPDIAEQIKKLGVLREQGLVTDEEFEAKKDELLSRM
jgi:hypothetical protein